jgi:hypothetical protein
MGLAANIDDADTGVFLLQNSSGEERHGEAEWGEVTICEHC